MYHTKEKYVNKIVHYTTMNKHSGYENLLKELDMVSKMESRRLDKRR